METEQLERQQNQSIDQEILTPLQDTQEDKGASVIIEEVNVNNQKQEQNENIYDSRSDLPLDYIKQVLSQNEWNAVQKDCTLSLQINKDVDNRNCKAGRLNQRKLSKESVPERTSQTPLQNKKIVDKLMQFSQKNQPTESPKLQNTYQRANQVMLSKTPTHRFQMQLDLQKMQQNYEKAVLSTLREEKSQKRNNLRETNPVYNIHYPSNLELIQVLRNYQRDYEKLKGKKSQSAISKVESCSKRIKNLKDIIHQNDQFKRVQKIKLEKQKNLHILTNIFSYYCSTNVFNNDYLHLNGFIKFAKETGLISVKRTPNSFNRGSIIDLFRRVTQGQEMNFEQFKQAFDEIALILYITPKQIDEKRALLINRVNQKEKLWNHRSYLQNNFAQIIFEHMMADVSPIKYPVPDQLPNLKTKEIVLQVDKASSYLTQKRKVFQSTFLISEQLQKTIPEINSQRQEGENYELTTSDLDSQIDQFASKYLFRS